MRVYDQESDRWYSMDHDFLVIKNLPNDALIGMDALNRFYYSVEFQTGRFIIRADLYPEGALERPITESTKSPLRTVHTETIRAGHTRNILVAYEKHLSIAPDLTVQCTPCVLRDKEGRVEQLVFPPHVQSPVGQNQRGQYYLTVSNLSDRDIRLVARTIIGAAQVVYSLDKEQPTATVASSSAPAAEEYDGRALLITTREDGEQEIALAPLSEADQYLATVSASDDDQKMSSSSSPPSAPPAPTTTSGVTRGNVSM